MNKPRLREKRGAFSWAQFQRTAPPTLGSAVLVVLLLRDAVPIKRRLLLQRRDHALAAQRLFSA